MRNFAPEKCTHKKRTDMITASQLESNQMIITFEDMDMMPKFKKMISALLGTKAITMPRKKKLNGIDQALLDIKEGRVYHAESVEDMFKQILGPDYVHS